MRNARALTDNKTTIQSFANQPLKADTPHIEDIARAKYMAERLDKYHQYGIRRTYHGFYYISHYYPLRAMAEVSPKEAKSTVESLAGSSFETYLHYPFCEQLCTFCHFDKKIAPLKSIARLEPPIVDALIAEIELNRSLLGERISARSLQIGGGTPSLMSNESLSRLLKACEKDFEIRSDAEIKIEVYPKLYDEAELRQKLRLLRTFGFTDLVVDLESGNQRSLDAINRKNSSLEKYLRTIEICISEGFDSFITAIMVGLPFETFESLRHTLDVLSSINEVTVLNVFPTIMRDTDPITRQLELSSEGFNDARTRDEMWIFARNYLIQKGYKEGPISYLHRPSVQPEQQTDKFECVNLIGFGPSSFGYLNGTNWAAQYYNYCDPQDHARRIRNKVPAIWRMGRYGQEERARRKVIFGLANVKVENLFELQDRYGVSVDKIYGRTFNALEEMGLIEIVPEQGGIRYTPDGLARLEEITYFLYSTYVKDCCDTLPDRSDEYYKWLVNQHYTVTMPADDRAKFESFEATRSDGFMAKLAAK